jgi:hypothetical protein
MTVDERTNRLALQEIEAMKRRVQEMEREATKLKEMQAQVVQEMSSEMSEGN